MARSQWDVFTEVGHIDKIATAVVDVLQADAILSSFSPIVRAPVPGMDPEFPKPVMWVTVPELAAPFQLAREIETSTTVNLTMAWEERRTILEPSEVSQNTWITQALKVLAAPGAMELQVPRYGNVSLVDRLDAFGQIETNFVAPGLRAQVEGELPMLFWVTVAMVYEWKASLDTLQPSPPGV